MMGANEGTKRCLVEIVNYLLRDSIKVDSEIRQLQREDLLSAESISISDELDMRSKFNRLSWIIWHFSNVAETKT